MTTGMEPAVTASDHRAEEDITPGDLITVVIPARNEEAFIGPCLDSVLAQDASNLQVIVVDGASTDRTAEIVRAYAGRDPRVELLHNPDAIVPISLNLGARAARGTWFVRIDAHATVPPGYVSTAVAHLRTGRWSGVGGRVEAKGTTPAGRAIAAAMGSRFGIGNAVHHYGSEPQPADHVPFPAYPMALVREMGGWNERLAVNQDFEFDYRLGRSGHRILYEPRLAIEYRCQQAIRGVFRQFRRYGRGKAQVVAMHPASMRARHLAPPAVIVLLASAALLALLRPVFAALAAAPYVAALALATAANARRLPDWPSRIRFPLALAAMHTAWGIGFYGGLARIALERLGIGRRAAADGRVNRVVAIDPDTNPGAAANPEAGGSGLAGAAVGGVGWEALSLFGGKTLLLVSTIILARILSPKDFGVVAMALVFIEYADVVADLGVAEAVVFLSPSRRTNDAAFTLSLIWSAGLVAVAMAAAPVVARFFHRPDIVTMFRVLSLSLFLGGTAEVPEALLFKHLRFRRRVKATLYRGIGQGAVSLALAVAGLGAWAIVFGYLAGDLVWNAVVWSVAGYRPGRRFWRLDPSTARPLLAFGVPAAMNSLVLVLLFNIDYLIVGRRLGSAALGYYTIAFRIPELVIIKVFYMLSRVAFPLFSRAKEDLDRLQRGYLASIRIQSAYGAAAGVGLAAIAPMLIHVLFGARWSPAIVPLEAIALYAAFRSLDAVDVYKGIGQPGVAVRLSLIRLAAVVPALWFAARYGINGVAIAQVILSFLMMAMMQGVASRVLGLRPSDLGRAVAPSLAVAAGTALGAGVVRFVLPGPEPLRLAIAIVAGAAGGLAVVWKADRTAVREFRSLIAPRRRAAGAVV